MPISEDTPPQVRPFDMASAPTLQARVVASTAPILFTRMRSDSPQEGRSIAPRPEDAFSFQLPLIPAPFSFLRYADRLAPVPKRKEPGCAYLLDLNDEPTVGLEAAFDNVRIYLAQATIDELAYENGLPPASGLVQPEFGNRDPVLFHLARAIVPALEDVNMVSTPFVEHLALAFHHHVVKTYGGVHVPERRRGGRLATWQLRRVREAVDANLAGDHSIVELARACGLSTSYFNDAFKATTGLSPHHWLLRQRIDRAKSLLGGTDLSLAAIAVNCGFYDQSHLSRVFSRLERRTPSAWRKQRHSG